MCGIVGFSGQFSEELLHRMNQAVAHRGPDAQGIYHVPEDQIGLGHRRLSIIDLSPLGHQPMWDLDHRVVIVYNGELYNYQELKASLISDGFRFRSETDTEVILNLYLRDGVDMLPRLNGIFAFALYDPSKKQLLLVRDGQGIKPLYLTQTPQGLLFASEMKSLLHCDAVDRTLNHDSIHYHLTYQWSPGPDTVLKSVQKLEPGHALLIQNGQIQRKWCYYDLPYTDSIIPMTEEEAAAALREHLQRAVERQLVADVPVGAFLSGGLDSSAVVAYAQKIQPDPERQCFTIGFTGNANPQGEGRVDDLPYAQQVAKELGVNLNTIYVGPEMFDQVERMLYHLDEPQADFAPIHVYFICKMARERGITVLLSGAGGDDLLTGYRRHMALSQEPVWSWLPRSARSLLRNASRHLPTSSTLGRRVAKAFQYADLNGRERIASYFHAVEPPILQQLYTPALNDSISGLPFSAPLMRTLANLPEDTPAINQMLYLEGKHFLPDHNLNYTDKMSMAVGVEVRVPLLDPDLIRFATRLPVGFKQRGLEGKWIFKKAMEPDLPHNVIYRPKTGFGVPMRRSLKHELRPLVEETLSESALKNRGLFEPKGVKRLLEMDREGKIDGSYVIFALMCMEMWMRIFIDRKTSWF